MRLLFVTLSASYLLLATSSQAMGSESALSASPAILETVVAPNKPNTTEITIQNNTNFPLPIKGSVSAFLANESVPENMIETFNASRWFTLDPPDFILQPKEVKKIKVSIKPPKNAEPGGHYATIYFRPLIPDDAIARGSTISLARIGVLAMMIVPGEIQEKLTQESLIAPLWMSRGPIPYITTLSNQGSIHLLPTTTLTIKNIWGKTVHEQDAQPSLILPQTNKERSIKWESPLTLGPYRATIVTTYGTDQEPLTSNYVTTWLIPWPLILTLLLLLTFIYKIFIVNRRRIVLAIQVLRGNYEPPQTYPKNSHRHPSPRRGTHSSLSSGDGQGRSRS